MKKYNYSKIRDEVGEIVLKACKSPNNKYKITAWSHHIVPVVEHGVALSKKLGADREVVELSALLHDYASIYNFSLADEHHIHSAELAEKILNKLNFPLEKIEHVKDCILSHRGSRPVKKDSLEAKILASADAMSHFTELADMMYLTYGIHKYSTMKGAIWLKNKLLRSWKKIIPEGRQMVKNEYDIAMKILNKTINNKN